ncbi:MAG: benzoate-CoA ligase family protein [Candidatus Rokubacteria bacterium]|nr:benzoate-CoA ligase family protein [Candidatus Rokubacteria bacterium]
MTDLPHELNAAAFFVDRHVTDGRGARTYFRFRGQPVTYAAISMLAARVGNALASLGVDIENRVVVALPDVPEFAGAFWGAAKLGAVSVPVNTLMSADEYAFVLNDSRAKVAIVDHSVAATFVSIRERTPFLRAIVVVGRAPGGTLAFDDVVGRAADRLDAARTFREDVVYWGYTSGSTGAPKAAVHSHKDLVAAADLVGVGVFGIDEADVILSASKLYFAFGLGNTLYFPARVGATAILEPERLDAERAFEVITRERPTVFLAVATLYARMLQVPDAGKRYDLSSLRLCVTSGEALPPPVFDAWSERFGIELADVVGSTEALHDFIATRPGKARRGSCGQVVPGFDARLVDDDGHDVPTGTVGHLLIRGETNAPYYWNRLERTRRTMLGEWLRTGDMLSCDAEGYFYFAGRGDDMLKVSGMWVSPAEVEACLLQHAAVLEAGVVGRATADGLVRPHAFVVLKPEATPSAALETELRAFARERLAGYKVPAAIDVVPEIPKTATGKIQRFRLRG